MHTCSEFYTHTENESMEIKLTVDRNKALGIKFDTRKRKLKSRWNKKKMM